MKIWTLCTDRGIAPQGAKGASVHFRSLAAALGRTGAAVTAFSSSAEPGTPFPVPLVGIQRRDDLTHHAEVFGAPDVIYQRYSLGGTWGLEVSRDLGSAFALEVNAPLVEEASRHRPHTIRPEHAANEEHLFQGADLVFVVSKPLAQRVARTRRSQDGIEVIPNGFDPRLFLDGGAGDPSAPPIIAFLGHPRPWHGVRRLPDLLARLRETGFDARLEIIGQGGDDLLALAASLGVSEHVHVTGALPQDEAVRRLVRARVLVAPYNPDPDFYFCPLKVIEGMASGIPQVVSSVGDVPDLVDDTALCVPPGDDAAFFDAVRRLLEDTELAHALAARARLRAFAAFTWDHVALRVVAAIASRSPAR